MENDNLLLSELHCVDTLPFEASEHKLLEENTATDWYQSTELFENYGNVVLMTEIQLKNIVERLKSSEKDTNTDGDETMVKDGVTISKFSFEALGLGPVLTITSRPKFSLVSHSGLGMIRYSQLKMVHQRS
jgi:hypothetical protein